MLRVRGGEIGLKQRAMRRTSDEVRDGRIISIGRRAVAEGLGTALLLAAVVGSGIMGERLSSGNVAIALLANSIATGAALVALILALTRVSGAHFNPVVSTVEALRGRLAPHAAAGYVVAQIAGAFVGVATAHVMFGEALFSPSLRARSGSAQLVSEFVATFGLVSVILGCARTRAAAIPFAVGAYITAAYWFTASTSFANPAVTLARAVTNTFSGIRPADAPGFIVAQILGGITAARVFTWLLAELPATADLVDIDALRRERNA
jgi:glycerol uptake facilitator-like aquaporin